ncbi:MAG: hypothetical protein NNA20_10450 [Nitrospira sp.]|nr:hypothetical protein [Nitrospira sp.]MCP9443006.1 hypothetical protein [Nitrospira sp.]
MNTRLSRLQFHRLALKILSIGGMTFFAAHSISAIIAHELAVPPSTELLEVTSNEPAIEPTFATGDGSTQFAEFIKSSGLFELPVTVRAMESGSVPTPAAPPLDVAAKVRLLGLVIGSTPSSAVLEDIASRQQQLFHLYEEVPGVGEIRSITREGIVIGQGTQEEWLPLTITGSDSALTSSYPSPYPSTPSPSVKPFAPPLKRVLDRQEVAAAVSDPAQLMKQAHIVPWFANDALNGFRLDFVLPSGFFDKAGFQYGDVIQRVNGVEIRDPGHLLSIFKQLLNERLVKVDMVRHNQPTTLTYELR